MLLCQLLVRKFTVKISIWQPIKFGLKHKKALATVVTKALSLFNV
jgi:hypothetical protein